MKANGAVEEKIYLAFCAIRFASSKRAYRNDGTMRKNHNRHELGKGERLKIKG
ncbi:hypothetical protein HW132_35770 [Brasilonema sp. CT11]|nr:hypothetical protein [Brasilonema sp. CT11]